MSGTPAWATDGRWLENLNDNDTSAEKENSSQGSAGGMLQQDRVLQGVRRSAGPILHIPYYIGRE